MGRTRARTGALAAAVVLAVLAVTVAACTNDGDNNAEGQRSASGGGGASVAREPGLVRLPATGELNLDPLATVVSDPTALITLDALYDGITTYRSGLVERDGTWLVPDEPELELASALEPNGDATVWVIRLGARTFSDGSPIKASDVKASFEYLARPGVRSVAGTRLSVVRGYGEFIDGSTPEITGLKVVDDQTLEISLQQPFRDLPALLASPLFGVLPARVVEEGLFVWEQLTSGSYVVDDETDDGRRMRLTRRPEVDAGPAAIEIVVFDDWQGAYDAFARGELDWSPVPAGGATEGEQADRFLVTPTGVTVWLALPAVAPFQDPVVRQALARLIDPEDLRDVALPDSDPLRSLVPEGVGGHVADACGQLCRPDREASVQVLRERFPEGAPEVMVTVLDDPTQRAIGDELVRALGEAGVPARMQSWTIDEWFEAIEQPPNALRLLGAVGIAPTQDDFLASFLATDGVVASLVDPGLAEVLGRMRVEADPGPRTTGYQELERRLLSQAIVLPIAQLQLRQAVASRVQGWSPRLDGSVDLSAVRTEVENE